MIEQPAQQHYCPRCNAPIAVGQAACTVCNLPLDAASIQAFYAYQRSQQAPQTVVLPQQPQPVYYPPPPRKNNVGRFMLGLLGLIMLACGLFYFLGRGGSGNTTNSSAGVNNNSGARATAPPLPAPSLEQIAAQKDGMTDLQWDAYAETLKGKQVLNWRGKVKTVDQAGFSDDTYRITVDFDDPVPGYAFDVQIDTKDTKALSINKEAAITVSGIIEEVDCLLTYCPIELREATWSSP